MSGLQTGLLNYPGRQQFWLTVGYHWIHSEPLQHSAVNQAVE